MAFLVIEDKLDEYLDILKKFDISPFAPVVLGKFNILHLAVIFSSSRFIRNLTNVDFYSMKKKARVKIDWREVCNIQTRSRLDNVLHLACRYSRIPVFKMFKALGVSLTCINIRGWKPLELAPGGSKFFNNEEQKQQRELFVKLRKEFIQEQKNLSQLKGDTKKEKKKRKAAMKKIEELRLDSYDVNYDYCVFARCDSNSVTKSTLYKLLENINTRGEDLLKNHMENDEEKLVEDSDLILIRSKTLRYEKDQSLKLTKQGF
jgi:hypothetical protein